MKMSVVMVILTDGWKMQAGIYIHQIAATIAALEETENGLLLLAQIYHLNV
jgi:hypothetical protein